MGTLPFASFFTKPGREVQTPTLKYTCHDILRCAQVESVQYVVGEQTARISAAAVLLNSKQMVSLAKALIQLQPASSPVSSQRDGPACSPAVHVPAAVQHSHSDGAASTDSPSSSIFDSFASSPVRSRYGATSPVKSPSKLGSMAPSAALPASPAQLANAPARLVGLRTSSESPHPARGAVISPEQTARRRPSLSPLVVGTDSPRQPPPAAGSLPGVFVPRVSPAASGELCSCTVREVS